MWRLETIWFQLGPNIHGREELKMHPAKLYFLAFFFISVPSIPFLPLFFLYFLYFFVAPPRAIIVKTDGQRLYRRCRCRIRWFLYPTDLYIGDFYTLSLSILVISTMISIQPLGTSMISTISIPYPYLQRWFLYPTCPYTGDFHTLSLFWWFRRFPRWFQWFLYPTPL